MTEDEKTLRHILDLARACVHRGQAYQALGYLNSVQSQIDDLAETSLWAEHELIYAGALGGMADPGAEVAFEETFERLAKLPEPDQPLKMLAHADFGKYLAEQRAYRRAREHYQFAERLAENLERVEDAAHYQMCIIRIDLEDDRNPQLGALQMLKDAAKDGYTALEQREAWIHYTEEFQGSGTQLVAARKRCEASVDYFRGVLSGIRRRRK